jgi:hypothetical protein
MKQQQSAETRQQASGHVLFSCSAAAVHDVEHTPAITEQSQQ